MTVQFRYFSARLARFGFTLAVSGLTLSAGLAAAQSIDPLDTHNEQTADPFTAESSDNNSTFFDLMHRVQLGNIRSVSEFSQDQQSNLGTEASDFRTRQRELLQQNVQPSGLPSGAAAQPIITAPTATEQTPVVSP